MKKLKEILIAPFQENLPHFVALLLFITVPFVYQFLKDGSILYAGFLFLHCFFEAYLLILPLRLLGRIFGKVYLAILYFVALIFFIADSITIYKFHLPWNRDVIAVVQGTNAGETTEFLKAYFTTAYILLLLLAVIVIISVAVAIGHYAPKRNKAFQFVCICCCFIGTALTIAKPEVFDNGLIGKVRVSVQAPAAPDLREHFTHPELVQTSPNLPKNVVMIIGESFSASHSSLYGYGKETNPRLQAIRESGKLYVFNHIQSPASNTIPTFQAMMSTYRVSDKQQDKAWYDHTTLQEVLKCIGYQTYWISNQSKYGLWDNVITKYAEICDTCLFAGDKYAGAYRTDLDENLIAMARPFAADTATSANRFFFIHLMGSHNQFQNRFPANFVHFQSADYPDRPESQRQVLSDYDNSILYNDSVVSELIQLFDGQEAIILYLSDHGLDVFDSSSDYVGNALKDNPQSLKAGRHIPFMFYTTAQFKEHFPNTVQRIEESTDRPYCSEDLIYTWMDIIGVKFTNIKDAVKYSLFSN